MLQVHQQISNILNSKDEMESEVSFPQTNNLDEQMYGMLPQHNTVSTCQ